MRLNCQLTMVANRQAMLATVEDLPRRRPGDSHPPHGNDKSRSEAGEDLVGFDARKTMCLTRSDVGVGARPARSACWTGGPWRRATETDQRRGLRPASGVRSTG